MKILSTAYYAEFPAWTWPDWGAEEVRKTFPDIRVVHESDPDRILAEITDADVLFAWRISEEQFARARKLRWIHTGMAGLTWLLIPPVVQSDVLVSNSKGVHAISIAEHTLGLMLALARRLPDSLDAQRTGRWRRTEIWNKVPSFEELYGKTLGILGLGTLGTEIGNRAKAFGMRVRGIKRNLAEKPACADSVHSPSELHALLPSLDYLVIAAPITAETNQMIGSRELSLMKPTAYLVNIARGEIVDQEALVRALRAGTIAGAGLDVFTPDPLPDGHELFSVPNIIITPHNSGVSPMLWPRVMEIFLENIRRFREGRELINQVRDKTKGY